MEHRYEWKSSYALGIPVIDAEHRGYFQTVSRIDGLVQRGGTPEALLLEVARLATYAQTHFANEEEFLAAVDCPEVEEQRAQHRRFSAEVRGLAAAPAAEILAFSFDWMLTHVLGTDRRYLLWLDRALPPPRRAAAVREYGVIHL